MFFAAADGLQPLFRPQDRDLLLEAIDVFAGELTCCRRLPEFEFLDARAVVV